MSKGRRLGDPWAPRAFRDEFGNGFGKIEMPSQQKEKRQICWCGDPNCPGEKRGGYSSSETTNSREGRDVTFSNQEILRREMSRMVLASAFGAPPFGEDRLRGESRQTEPRSYRDAREKVKDFLLEVKHETAWDDIIGNDAARSALTEAVQEAKNNPGLYEHYGMTPPKGVLLYGPPGCGKTMFAKAAAAAVDRIYGTDAEVLVVNGPSIQSPFVGKTEQTIRDIFAFAREYKEHRGHPLTVFFDEAEVLFPDRTGRTRRVASWEESNVAQFLSEMDGLNSMGAFVILATNRPEAIDEALLRDGRCDRKIKVERPSKTAVEHILRKVFADVPLSDDLEALVMAGTESFFNPHYVIHEARAVAVMMGVDGPTVKDQALNFCLEHVVSGAMVTGVARRAKSRAFQRDKAAGTRSGVGVSDVIGSVKEIFEENKGLEHAFALKEFFEGLPLKEMFEPKGRVQ